MEGDKMQSIHMEHQLSNETIPDSKSNNDATYYVPKETQARIRRAFDTKMLPVVCTLYVLSYLDRGNIGNAKSVGLDVDLGLNDFQWTWVLNAFYICYVLFEWTQILWKILPAHIYVACLCAAWGTAATCSASVQNHAGLIVCRCFLGIFEASFGAGAPYFLSLFYQRRELAFRVALLTGMSPLANCFAGALAYGITQISSRIEPWRWLFIIEGLPTILFAPVVFFFLVDSPGSAKFLTEVERTQAVERMQTKDRTAKSKVHWKQFFAGLKDFRNFVHMSIHFCCNYSFAGLSNFLPTIIEAMGYESVDANGLSAPVYFASFLLCVAAAFVSDKFGQRGFIIAGFATMGCIGYLILAIVEDMEKTGVRYAGVWLAVCGIFPALSINIAWLMNNNSNDSKRGAGLAILAIFGQCSSFMSSAVFPDADYPFFVKGCAIGCGFTGAIVVLSLGLRTKLAYDNKQRDRRYGEVSVDEQIDVSELGDTHPQYRYML